MNGYFSPIPTLSVPSAWASVLRLTALMAESAPSAVLTTASSLDLSPYRASDSSRMRDTSSSRFLRDTLRAAKAVSTWVKRGAALAVCNDKTCVCVCVSIK